MNSGNVRRCEGDKLFPRGFADVEIRFDVVAVPQVIVIVIDCEKGGVHVLNVPHLTTKLGLLIMLPEVGVVAQRSTVTPEKIDLTRKATRNRQHHERQDVVRCVYLEIGDEIKIDINVEIERNCDGVFCQLGLPISEQIEVFDWDHIDETVLVLHFSQPFAEFGCIHGAAEMEDWVTEYLDVWLNSAHQV